MKKLSNSKIDNLVLKSSKRAKKKKWIRYCPVCKSVDVALDARMEMIWYRCRKCSYSSASFPEKAVK